MRKRVRAARGYGGPREWVLTAALADAARGPSSDLKQGENGLNLELKSVLFQRIQYYTWIYSQNRVAHSGDGGDREE